jgi:hypothetical protein
VGVRVAAILTFALLIAYHLMRAAATACQGSACDLYIPLSLLLPLLVVIAAAVTGILAVISARRRPRWLILLGTAAIVSVVGPSVLLLLLRDRPDAFVVSATISVAVVPLAALIYTFSRRASTIDSMRLGRAAAEGDEGYAHDDPSVPRSIEQDDRGHPPGR